MDTLDYENSESEHEELLDESGSDTTFDNLSSSSSNSESSIDLSRVRTWFELQSDAPAPPSFPFTAVPSISCASTTEWTALDFFEQFVDEDLVSHIVTETNRLNGINYSTKRCEET